MDMRTGDRNAVETTPLEKVNMNSFPQYTKTEFQNTPGFRLTLFHSQITSKTKGVNNTFRMLLHQICSVINCHQVFLLNNQVLISRESIISIQIYR